MQHHKSQRRRPINNLSQVPNFNSLIPTTTNKEYPSQQIRLLMTPGSNWWTDDALAIEEAFNTQHCSKIATPSLWYYTVNSQSRWWNSNEFERCHLQIVTAIRVFIKRAALPVLNSETTTTSRGSETRKPRAWIWSWYPYLIQPSSSLRAIICDGCPIN